MKRFEIFYADGLIVRGSSVQDWDFAPVTGVQAVIYLHDDMSAREKVYGFDSYTLQADGAIVGADGPAPERAKIGTLINTENFKEIKAGLEQRSAIWGKSWDG